MNTARGQEERKNLLAMVGGGMIGADEVYEIASADRVIGVIKIKSLLVALPSVGKELADEVLWLSGIHARTKLRDLNDEAKQNIDKCIALAGQWESPPGWPYWAE